MRRVSGNERRRGGSFDSAGVCARSAVFAAAVVGLCPAQARANERHFAFTYESATLPAGRAEIEPQVTFRYGRQEFYSGLDYRLEFEGGITDRLQGSIYFNGGSEVAGPMQQTTHQFRGTSIEFKYHVLDAVADPVGLSGYLELSYGPLAAEIEAKIILDKRVGNFLVAANIVGAHEWNWEAAQLEQETEFEVDLGLAYFVTREVTFGIEARNHNNYSDLPGNGFEYSVIYAGPTASYAFDRFWVVATVMPQLGALHGASANDFRNLEDHEMLNARIIAGFHF